MIFFYLCFYPHRLKDSVSHICGIFLHLLHSLSLCNYYLYFYGQFCLRFHRCRPVQFPASSSCVAIYLWPMPPFVIFLSPLLFHLTGARHFLVESQATWSHLFVTHEVNSFTGFWRQCTQSWRRQNEVRGIFLKCLLHKISLIA